MVADVAENYVGQLIEPYSENLEVEAYPETCWCVGRLAEQAAEKQTVKYLGCKDMRGVYQIIWDAIDEQWPEIREENESRWLFGPADLSGSARDFWQECHEVIGTLLEDFAKAHPAYEQPDPDCEECHGTGTRMNTYNPDSKWDWWVIGGRWDGEISGAEEIDDGKGGFNFGDEFHQVNRNYAKVSDLDARAEIPFALITPDGVWHERGQGGWWGNVHDPKDTEDWELEVLNIYKQYPDAIAIGIDYHI